MQTFEAFIDSTHPDAPVRGYLHRPPDPAADCLILTHGAGVNCQAPLLVALADAFCAAGITVLRCDLPFRQARPSGPPPRGAAERDQGGLRAAVEAMRRMNPRHVFLGGHSYGGRQASILAASDPRIADALLLLSYPLHPPKQPAQLRTAHFPSLQVPALFVHGVRDGFATSAEMESALSLIPARTEILSVVGAGHELMTKTNRDNLIAQVTNRFAAFTHPTA
ncbi:alpha/beta hydrolase family protein [Occallatibacter riparius]|uniref:Alpha/beta hydrolase n=1 Tax=Occallatibacter riparius TaxID=1002689 RepID=A0A9J7BPM8_9BACT|nr:alpha/beta family hydrolase [Occallatibacter riparius]UWZ83085.1 alpha/beta hydrolase [Occallatibacter riparius]